MWWPKSPWITLIFYVMRNEYYYQPAKTWSVRRWDMESIVKKRSGGHQTRRLLAHTRDQVRNWQLQNFFWKMRLTFGLSAFIFRCLVLFSSCYNCRFSPCECHSQWFIVKWKSLKIYNSLIHWTCDLFLTVITCRRLMAAEASEISLNVTKAWPLNFGAFEIMISSTLKIINF